MNDKAGWLALSSRGLGNKKVQAQGVHIFLVVWRRPGERGLGQTRSDTG
jgi:hypothetical protein